MTSTFQRFRASKTKVKIFYLHARRTLATVSSDYKHLIDTEPYDIFSKSSYNDTQFK